MKTIPQLERRQKELLRELEGIRNKRTQDKKDKTKIKKICKELEVIRLCVRYLETDPERRVSSNPN